MKSPDTITDLSQFHEWAERNNYTNNGTRGWFMGATGLHWYDNINQLSADDQRRATWANEDAYSYYDSDFYIAMPVQVLAGMFPKEWFEGVNIIQ